MRIPNFLATLAALVILAARTTAQDPQRLNCEFSTSGGRYRCSIAWSNVTSVDEPLPVSGEHSANKTSTDVVFVTTPTSPPHRAVMHVLHPQLFEEFPNMQELVVWYASLSVLHMGGCGRLERLEIYANELGDVAGGAFAGCSRLRELEIGHADGLRVSRGSFDGLSGLEVLKLRFNRRLVLVDGLLDDVVGLRGFYFEWNGGIEARALDSLRGLEDLQISGFEATFEHFEELLGGGKNLTSITLTHDRLAAVNFRFFSQFEALDALVLDDNAIFSVPADSFAGMSRLRLLSLSNNPVGELKADSFAGLSGLQLLRLRNCSIQALPSLPFGHLASLSTLDLGLNFLRFLGARLFDGNERLETVDFGGNRLARIEAGVFRSLPQLTEVVLTGNNISDLGARAFVDLPSLRFLHLQENRLRVLRSDAVGLLPNVTSLFLNGNRLEAIEPGFFENLPRLWIFWANGNVCIDREVFNANADLEAYEQCFRNWLEMTTVAGGDGTSSEGSIVTTVGTTMATPGGAQRAAMGSFVLAACTVLLRVFGL